MYILMRFSWSLTFIGRGRCFNESERKEDDKMGSGLSGQLLDRIGF